MPQKEPRTYNSLQLAQNLRAIAIELSPDRLRRCSKKGHLETSKKEPQETRPKTKEIKQSDLDMELSAATGEIDLKYLDESGFCMWSEKLHLLPTGEQKCLEQTKRRGRRLSIIGFFNL